eukprot:TRINITY_DN7177_c0_g1_i1.p1 TRINITY_DN7177_c0_g1~~TRINITY_DN7177_c0_g1_i1.p1  ORF type:complete len:176 (+),score=23.45 TRINITY_DN7177_c0_g1_i1:55-582(+)
MSLILRKTSLFTPFRFVLLRGGPPANKKVAAKLESGPKQRTVKVVRKEKGKKVSEDSNEAHAQMLLQAMKPRIVPKEQLTEADLTERARIAKTYNHFMRIRHNYRARVENAHIKAKWNALHAMPEGLRAACLKLDETPFPTNRVLMVDTPPYQSPYTDKYSWLGPDDRVPTSEAK